jgi:ribonuclease HII
MTDGSGQADRQTSLVVGIDEAGYGPLLGPLVVSAVAFEVPVAALKSLPSAADGPDLWAILRRSVTDRASRRDSRLAVADSKKLFTRKGGGAAGLNLLERAALSFLAQNGPMPATMRELLGRVCPGVIEQLWAYPWYADADVNLPIDCHPDALSIQRSALAGDMKDHGITFRGAWVEVLPEGHFNRLVGATRNKAVVLFGQTLRLVQRIAAEVGPRPLRVWIDRQGGRVGYRRPIMTAFDDVQLDVIEESPERSSYRLNHRPAPWMVRFVKKGESHHLPIALASIFSKYVRELFMAGFNRYWAERVSGLPPTAGYYQDALRFLADIEPVIRRDRVDRAWLVRTL